MAVVTVLGFSNEKGRSAGALQNLAEVGHERHIGRL